MKFWSLFYPKEYSSKGLRILKVVTILAPAIFIGLFELSRHTIFVESQPMTIGNLLVFVAVIVGAYFFSMVS